MHRGHSYYTRALAGNDAPAGPLDGLLVVDAGILFAAPLCGTLLGDLGADVVKIEHPQGGDALRHYGWQDRGESLWWKVAGRNKRSLTLDLSKPEGQDVFVELARRADVVLENFRPGTLERWNVGWERLHGENPRLVLLRVSGFGQTGPYRNRPGFGTLAESMSGFAAMSGYPDRPPLLPPFALADSVAALMGAAATLAAVYRREQTGEGQMIDLSLVEPLLWILGPHPAAYDRLGIVQERSGNRSPFVALRNAYETKDGRWLGMAASSQPIAARVLSIIGGPELAADPRFATNVDRLEHEEELEAIVSAWMTERTLDEIMAAFEAGEGAIAQIYDVTQIVADPHLREREALVRVPDPALGDVLMQGVPAKLSATPGSIRSTGPALGEHTDEILTGLLGLDAAAVERLRAAGAV